MLPVYRHAFGKKMIPFSQRLRLCRQMFRGLDVKIKVKDLEKRLGGVSWTLRLVKFLMKKYPKNRFYLVVGSDAYAERKKWRGFQEFETRVPFIVFPRGPRSLIPHISSTEIRRGWKKDL